MAFVGLFENVKQTFFSSGAQVNRPAKWSTRSSLPPMSRQPSNPYQISVPNDLQKRVRAFMDAAAPAVAAGFNRHMQPVAQEAFEAWPVKSGFSKSTLALDYFVEDGGQTFRAQTVVRAFYAGLITARGSKKKVAPILLIRPFEVAAFAMATGVADDIVKELK